jgi:hypothetical protein
MPAPGDLHVNKPLTNISVAHLQELEDIATKIFPVVPVQKQSDRYFVYDKGDLLRTEAAARAPGTESAGVDYDIDNTPNYSCQKIALHIDVDDDEIANADAPLSPERDAALILTQKLSKKRDLLFVDSFFKGGVWETDWDGVGSGATTNEVNQWDSATGHPIVDVDNLKEAVSGTSGFKPNVGLMGSAVFNVVKNHSDVLARIQYTQRGIVTPELLASLFGLDRLIIAEGVYNSSAKGQANSIDRIFGKHFFLAYAPKVPSVRMPSAGYTFSWAGLYGAGNDGLRSKRFRMEHLNSWRVENEMAYDMKVVSADCGGFIEDVIG